jgi:dTDP-glucose 4,6-dehydratase
MPQYTDTNGMREGLQQTIDWYAANKDWWQSQKAVVESSYREAGEKVVDVPKA